ncbi:hypothetical protein ABT287_42465 [Streptomyces olivaceoviridis]
MEYELPRTASPPRSDANAIRVPSGDRLTPRSSHGPDVSRRGPEPSGAIVPTWNPPP